MLPPCPCPHLTSHVLRRVFVVNLPSGILQEAARGQVCRPMILRASAGGFNLHAQATRPRRFPKACSVWGVRGSSWFRVWGPSSQVVLTAVRAWGVALQYAQPQALHRRPLNGRLLLNSWDLLP